MAEIKWREVKPEYGEYHAWLASVHGLTNLDVLKNHYMAVTARVEAGFRNAEFWVNLGNDLSNINDLYKIDKKERLLNPVAPTITVKPWDSFLSKTFRKNILTNKNYPSPPDGGWVLPPDWTSKINDLVRTMFVVRYLDGVDFLSERLSQHIQNAKCFIRRDYEAKIEGYYAIHLYASASIEVPDLEYNSIERDFVFEIQITTEVKEFVKSILHHIYDSARISSDSHEKTWAWNYESDEFIAHNLGHMVHYVEGMLVQVRDRQRGTR